MCFFCNGTLSVKVSSPGYPIFSRGNALDASPDGVERVPGSPVRHRPAGRPDQPSDVRRGSHDARSATDGRNGENGPAGADAPGHEHPHDHQVVPDDIALRVRALESILVDKQMVDPAAPRRGRRRPTRTASVPATGPGSWRGPGPTPPTRPGCSTTRPRPSPSSGSGAPRASTWWSSRTPPRCTTSSCARSAPAIRGRPSDCRRSGTRSDAYRARAGHRAARGAPRLRPRARRRRRGAGVGQHRGDPLPRAAPAPPPAPRAMTEEELAGLVSRDAMIGVAAVPPPAAGRPVCERHPRPRRDGRLRRRRARARRARLPPPVGRPSLRAPRRLSGPRTGHRAGGASATTSNASPPAEYLRLSYYERWFAISVNRLLRSGPRDAGRDRDGAAAARAAGGRPLSPGAGRAPRRPPGRLRRRSVGARASGPGQDVRARNLHPPGHTRLPRYTRGKAGRRDPRQRRLRAAGHRRGPDRPSTGPPQHVLHRALRGARPVGGERAAPRDAVFADLWEDYLEPV